jgi:plastocyanin
MRRGAATGAGTMARMRAAPTAACLTACLAVALGSGCGSSSSGTGSAGSTAAASTSTASPASPKAIGTPKYGTPPASSPVLSGDVKVAYRNIAIEPDTLRVKVGSTITWTNYDSIEHNVTSEGGPQTFASKDIGESATFKIVADKPGVIHYECTIHPASMNGTIVVEK